jgi:PIN domain nuclease of toxin-antitoxin system
MNLLLDTHILVWALGNTARLSERAKTLLSNANNALWYSPVTAIEIAIKNSTGRHAYLMNLDDFDDACSRAGLVELPLSTSAAKMLEALPMHHRDPFDRTLLAQASAAGMALLTADTLMPAYGRIVEYVGP